MSYEEKYLKYKNKYLALKKNSLNQTGGSMFNFSSLFNTSSPESTGDVKQMDIQNEIVAYNNLTNKMKTINSKVNDPALTDSLNKLEGSWKLILNNLVNLLKLKEEGQKKYNGLAEEIQRKQANLYELKRSIDSLPRSLAVGLKKAKEFITTVQIETRKSESKLAEYESKIANRNATSQYNSLIHERRLSLSEDKKSRSRSSSKSSLKSLGSTPSSPVASNPTPRSTTPTGRDV
jgi:hypothetical protein